MLILLNQVIQYLDINFFHLKFLITYVNINKIIILTTFFPLLTILTAKIPTSVSDQTS